MASWERFLGAMSWLQFPDKLASISLMNSHRFYPRLGHDHAVIGPQSRRDRATIVVQIVSRSPSARC